MFRRILLNNGTDNSTTTVAAGLFTADIAVNAVTNKIYVANGNSNTVTVISGDGNAPPAPTPQTCTPTTTVS